MRFAPLFLSTLLCVSAAYADNGSDALLIIRFNQKHVYFDKALATAVQSVEKAKPGSVYNVVSYTPPSIQDAQANLQAVTQQMQALGIPGSRIESSSQPSDEVKSQEIRIFVE